MWNSEPRQRKVLRIALLAVFVVAIVWGLCDAIAGWQLQDCRRNLKSEGKLTSPARLISAEPASNAAFIYMETLDIWFATDNIQTTRQPAYIAGLNREAFELLTSFITEPKNVDQRCCHEILSETSVEHTLRGLREAAALPDCAFPLQWEAGANMLLPHYRPIHQATTLIAAKALCLLMDGHTEDAWNWAMVGLRMCEHMTAEPSPSVQTYTLKMVQTMIGIICQLAEKSPPEAWSERDIAHQLTAIDDMQMRTCRLMPLMTIASMDLGYEASNDGLSIVRSLRRFWHMRLLRCLEAVTPVIASPFRVERNRLISLAEEEMARIQDDVWPTDDRLGATIRGISSDLTGSLFTSMVCANQLSISGNRDCMTALLRMTRIALALHKYKWAHGSYPHSLSSLPRETLPLAEDPFSDSVCKYRVDGTHAVLYSVGPDLIDDGGPCLKATCNFVGDIPDPLTGCGDIVLGLR